MLHMVVASHGPDTCAAVSPEIGELARGTLGQLEQIGQKHGVGIQGVWVDAPAHVFYLLADAPNAHAVNDLMVEAKMFHWNTVDIHPVQTAQEAMSLTAGS